MSPSEAEFFRRVHAKVATLSPTMAAAIVQAFRNLARELTDAELTALITAIKNGQPLTSVLSEPMLDRAFAPVRRAIYDTVVEGVAYSARTIIPPMLPRQTGGPSRLSIGFNVLNPRTIDAIRALDTKVVQAAKDDVREVLRAFVENGIRDGVNPREIARQVRSTVGLSPTQATYVENLRTELLERRYSDATRRMLLDKRFNLKALDKLPEAERLAKIERYVESYRKRMIAYHAETLSRTAALDAMKQAQRLAVESAIDQGILDRARMTKRWVGVMDARERPEHVRMEAETVPIDAAYSNGEQMPGESTYNCRCLSRYVQSTRPLA